MNSLLLFQQSSSLFEGKPRKSVYPKESETIPWDIGRKYKLSTIEDKLLLRLAFYRFYLTDKLMGCIFGLHPSNACRMRIKMEHLVEKAADPFLSQSINEWFLQEQRRLLPGKNCLSCVLSLPRP